METGSVGDRIKQLCDNKGITPYELSVRTGVSRSVFTRLFANQDTKLNIRNTDLIAQFFQVSSTYILTGKDDVLAENSPVINARQLDLSEQRTIAPLIGQYAYAGYLSGFADEEFVLTQPKYVAMNKYSEGNYVAFEIKGDSMRDGSENSIRNGDLVLCRELVRDYWRSRLHIPRVFVIVCLKTGIVCKEIIDHDVETGIITCHSYNKEYEDFQLSLSDVQKLFYIKEISRKTL